MATVPAKVVGGFGTGFRPLTATASPSAIFGLPIRRSLAPSLRSIWLSVKRLVLPIMWNAGTIPYANAWVALSANPMSFTTSLSNFSFITTTLPYPYQSFLSHYPTAIYSGYAKIHFGYQSGLPSSGVSDPFSAPRSSYSIGTKSLANYEFLFNQATELSTVYPKHPVQKHTARKKPGFVVPIVVPVTT